MTSASDQGFKVEVVPATPAASLALRHIEGHSGDPAHPDPIGPLLWPKLQSKASSEQEISGTTPAAGQSSTAEQSPWSEEEIAREVEFLKLPSNWYQWVIDVESGEPVAYGWWQHQKGKSEAQWKEAWDNRYRPADMNAALMDATSGVRFQKRAQLLGNEDVLILKELYVLHSFQRRGLGSMLVAAGVARADTLSLPAYTEASPEGLQLYLRYGFVEVDRVTVDLEEWGGKKGDVNSYGLLFRQPVHQA